MTFDINNCPGADGAATGGRGIAELVADATNASVANRAGDRNRPGLRLALNRHWPGRLWAMVEQVDCKYSIGLDDLDQPAFLAGRILYLAQDLRGDRGWPSYAPQIQPVLERLLIGPHYSFAEWDADVDAALAAAGLVAEGDRAT
jgi:hypothetical protein